ncbi:MAG TPA: hypothetical protein VMT53_08700 [Terriglobales bacterium]|nr:hypothetical protein [Terriglobales bacterium]
MPDRRFVRRRNRIPDQPSPVSTQEQARLLNDPGVRTDNMHRTTSSEAADYKTSGGDGRQTGRALVENEKTA